MTRSEIKNLEKRVRGLAHQSSSTDDAGGARMAWLIHHLTEEERVETYPYFKRLKTNHEDKDAEERLHELFAKAEIRGDARPASLREEFYQKHSRAEELRNMRRPLTDMEGEELAALNAWFEKFQQEPRTFEEQLEAGRKELENDPELRRREGLDPVESYADERGGD